MIERQYPEQPANLEYLPPELRFNEMVPPDIKSYRIEASVWKDIKAMLSSNKSAVETVKSQYIASQNIGERVANIGATVANTAAQIGVWSAAGMLGFGAVGSMFAAFGAGNIIDSLIPVEAIKTHFVERRALQGISKAIMPGAFSTDLSGRGFTRNQAEDVLKHFQHLQNKYNTSFEDLQRNLTDFVNFGMISGVSSVKDFENKFDKLLENVKHIMKTLHTTQEKALTMLKSFEQSGVGVQNVPYLLSQTQQASFLTGEQVPDIMKRGLAFARTFQGTGMTGTAGYSLGTGIYTALRTAQISGALDQNTLWQYGNLQNAAASAMQRSVQYFNTPLGDITLRAGMTMQGGFSMDQLFTAAAGSPFAAIGRASAIMSNPNNYLSYIANKEKYMSRIFEASPALAPSLILKSLEDQMRAAGIKMTYTNLVGFGKMRGVDVNLIAPLVESAKILPTSAQEEFKRRIGMTELAQTEAEEWDKKFTHFIGHHFLFDIPELPHAFTKARDAVNKTLNNIGWRVKTGFINMADNIADALDMHASGTYKFSLSKEQIQKTIRNVNLSTKAISDSAFGSDQAANVTWIKPSYTFSKSELEGFIREHAGAEVYGDRLLEGLHKTKSTALRILDMEKAGDISHGQTKSEMIENYMRTYSMNRRQAEEYFEKNVEKSGDYIIVKHNAIGGLYSDNQVHVFKRKEISQQMANKREIYNVLSDYTHNADNMFSKVRKASDSMKHEVSESLDKNFNYDKFKKLTGEEQTRYLVKSILGKPLSEIEEVTPELKSMLGIGMAYVHNRYGVDLRKINTKYYSLSTHPVDIESLQKFAKKTISSTVNDIISLSHRKEVTIPGGGYGTTSMHVSSVDNNPRIDEALNRHYGLFIEAATNEKKYSELIDAIVEDTGLDAHDVATYIRPSIDLIRQQLKGGGKLSAKIQESFKSVQALHLGELEDVLAKKMKSFDMAGMFPHAGDEEKQVLSALRSGAITGDFSKKAVRAVAQRFGYTGVEDYTTLATKVAQQVTPVGEQSIAQESYGPAVGTKMVNLLDGMLKTINTQRQILEDMKKSMEH